MTIRHPSEVSPPTPPQRSGEPWTDEDYESLVHLCREGLDLTTLSQQLGRAPQSVRDRAKRMLPLDQRGVPGDRALTQLRKNLLDDPDYDWGRHLAATSRHARQRIDDLLDQATSHYYSPHSWAGRDLSDGADDRRWEHDEPPW